LGNNSGGKYKMSESSHGYTKKTKLITIIGALMLLAGIAVGFLGPLEMYCFYLFSEGGRFSYEDFGFGSFMFGNIASQIIGYYLIAAVLIVVGYGHLKMRRWVRKLSLALLWFWLVAGGTLSVAAFLILSATKELPYEVALFAIIILGLSYFVLPWLLIKFYNSQKSKEIFSTKEDKHYWTDNISHQLIALCLLYFFYIVVFHILILFKGIYPVFGLFVYGFDGIFLIDISIMCLAFLIWGTLRQRLWAWWGGVIFTGLFAVSTVVTFLRTSYADLLSMLSFPPAEMSILEALPVQGYHLAVLAGVPLILTWVMAILSKRCYMNEVR